MSELTKATLLMILIGGIVALGVLMLTWLTLGLQGLDSEV